jgi:hypothetical protein
MSRLVGLLVASVLVLAACGDETSSAPSARGAGDMSFRCPDPAAGVDPTTDDTLPPGPRAALICPMADGTPWRAPREPLTRDVERLVALVNSQPRSPRGDGCLAEAGPEYRIVLDYPDGARLLNGDFAGCRDLQVGASHRVGGRTVWQAYFRLLARQRALSSPDGMGDTRPFCPSHGRPVPSTPIWDARTITRARFCLPRTRRAPGVSDGVRMSGRDLRLLRHDMLSSAARRQRPPIRPDLCDRHLGLGYDVVAVDRWGDLVDIRGYCEVYPMVIPGSSRSAYVRELRATHQMFERLAVAGER